MKKIMLCSKKSGNTNKVCTYVSSHSDIALEILDGTAKNELPDEDVIVLASGVYGNHVHKNITAWINSIEKKAMKEDVKIYLFLTWFGRGDSDKAAFNETKELLSEKGIVLQDNYVTCFGKGMGVIRGGHPDEEECKKVLSWANELQ